MVTNELHELPTIKLLLVRVTIQLNLVKTFLCKSYDLMHNIQANNTNKAMHWCLKNQGIIDMNRNGNLCKGTCVSKVIAETKVHARVDKQKKFTGFSRMSVMAKLLCFGCFAAG